MTDYVLLVRYGDAEAPVRVELPECTPGDAETARQALLREVEHAVEIEAPSMYTTASQAATDARITIDPHRVTSIDLVEASVSE